ncbi:Predicted membrane protein [Actinobacillus equuli]|nr:Predicted membrane protein [Actinobacillus equuli]
MVNFNDKHYSSYWYRSSACFAIYDQVIMPKLKGETKLTVQLQRQVKGDAWILIGLITLTMVYGVQNGIESLTIIYWRFQLYFVFMSLFTFATFVIKRTRILFANVFLSMLIFIKLT